MGQTVCILGRQPAIGLAELESLFGADALQPIGTSSVIVNKDPSEIPKSHLGGTMKVCKLLTTLPFTDWAKIETYLTETYPQHLHHIPEGKIRLGLSVYGLNVPLKKLNASGLALKRVVKSAGRSVRIVPNNEPALNSAQVLHNQLTGPTGHELVMVANGKETVLAQTVAVQDIEAYAARDQARPKRDSRVGMLPPKLAQVIINLATSHVKENGERREDKEERAHSSPPAPHSTAQAALTVLDPFCGTGVILQESLLMGHNAYGTDLEPRLVEYSQENLEWLSAKARQPVGTYKVEVADATNHVWDSYDLIACETYLGRPFSSEPKPEILREVMQDVDTIHRKFLKNVARQTKPGFKMCIAVPAWSAKNGFKHLKVLDSLEDLGYTRLGFVHVPNDDLIYHRKGQVVARELVVLQRL